MENQNQKKTETDPTLEPLQPLESELGEAFSRLLDQPQQTQEPVQTYVPPQHLRRIARVSTETCPKGLAGMCLICQEFPCKYLKARILRALLVDVEYGKP